ncbi:MAG: CoA-transferase [Dehalococcoidia bacterium]|nr:CoA-transferase [Dehalococcoidia bacterium]
MTRGPQGKLMTAREAVERFVRDGEMVYFGGFGFMQAFALSHEVIRQRKRDLTVVREAGDILVDQLIGAGCVRRVIASHLWNPIGPSSAYCFRRAMEEGDPPIEMEEMGYGAISMALMAGALDLPFMPTTEHVGTGQFENRSFLGERKFQVVQSPFSGDKVTVVAPLKPDVGLIHVQRADVEGNSQVIGPLGNLKYGANACRTIVVSAEEIVDKGLIQLSSNLTIIPGFRVAAVVRESWGAHPSEAFGYYDRDIHFAYDYSQKARPREGLRAFLDEWVYGVADRQEYARKLGEEKLRALALVYRFEKSKDWPE